MKIWSKNHVLIENLWVNHYLTIGLEKNVQLVVNVISRMQFTNSTIFLKENRKVMKIYFGISAGNLKGLKKNASDFYSHWHSFLNPSLRN